MASTLFTQYSIKKTASFEVAKKPTAAAHASKGAPCMRSAHRAASVTTDAQVTQNALDVLRHFDMDPKFGPCAGKILFAGPRRLVTQRAYA